MKLCLFGGTAFLGQAIAQAALSAGHEVICAARGISGEVPRGARHLLIDRSTPNGYEVFGNEEFDGVIDLTWQPTFAREALEALSPVARQWLFISSVSVYFDHSKVAMDESSPLLPSFQGEVATLEHYGAAKVACEQEVKSLRGDQCLVIRPGLIGGPGDQSDRSGAWVARCATDPSGPLLVPRSERCHVQVLDVRDLAAFVVSVLERELTGTVNAVGDAIAFKEFIECCRRVAGHHGAVHEVDGNWLAERGVEQWSGPESMACFVDDPEMAGWGQVSTARADALGLRRRPLEHTLTDTLADERKRGLERPRRAGLSRRREDQLLSELFS